MAAVASPLGAALAMSSPFALPLQWDSVTVAGVTWGGAPPDGPSFSLHDDAKRLYKWETKSPAGTESWIQTYRGQEPSSFVLTFYMWKHAHWVQWVGQFQELFKYTGTKGRVIPVGIFHPALAALGISQIICKHIGAVHKVNDELLFAAKVMVEEYNPQLVPIDATTTPKVAAVASKPNVPGVAIDPDVAAAAAALAEAKAKDTAISEGLANGLPK